MKPRTEAGARPSSVEREEHEGAPAAESPPFVQWILKHQDALFSPGTDRRGKEMQTSTESLERLEWPRPSAYAYTAPSSAPRAPLRGLVELTSKCDTDVLRQLISAAHEASVDGPVVLVLNGVPQDTVDDVLRQVERVQGPGDVRCVTMRSVDNQLLARAAVADFVIVQSSALSGTLLSRGIRYMTTAKGLGYLAACGPGGHAAGNQAPPR